MNVDWQVEARRAQADADRLYEALVALRDQQVPTCAVMAEHVAARAARAA